MLNQTYTCCLLYDRYAFWPNTYNLGFVFQGPRSTLKVSRNPAVSYLMNTHLYNTITVDSRHNICHNITTNAHTWQILAILWSLPSCLLAPLPPVSVFVTIFTFCRWFPRSRYLRFFLLLLLRFHIHWLFCCVCDFPFSTMVFFWLCTAVLTCFHQSHPFLRFPRSRSYRCLVFAVTITSTVVSTLCL